MATVAHGSDRHGPPDREQPPDRSERSVIAGFTVSRLLGNLFVRFPFVFINPIARGLGVDVSTLTKVFGARELGGLEAPMVGRWVDRCRGARAMVVCGLVAGAACAAAATSNFALFT